MLAEILENLILQLRKSLVKSHAIAQLLVCHYLSIQFSTLTLGILPK